MDPNSLANLRSARASGSSQPLDELDLKIVMLDGIYFRDHCILVALGVDSDGHKHPLVIREGNTEIAVQSSAPQLLSGRFGSTLYRRAACS